MYNTSNIQRKSSSMMSRSGIIQIRRPQSLCRGVHCPGCSQCFGVSSKRSLSTVASQQRISKRKASKHIKSRPVTITPQYGALSSNLYAISMARYLSTKGTLSPEEVAKIESNVAQETAKDMAKLGANEEFTNAAAKAVAGETESVATTAKPTIDLTKVKHDGLRKYGPDLWKDLVTEASRRTNTFLTLEEQRDIKASGADAMSRPHAGLRLTPTAIHENYRDLSHLPRFERFGRYADLWLSAVQLNKVAPPKSKAFNLWISSLILLVFSMVAVGGLTRLTRSGLSMTHWKFFGEKRPTNPAEWDEEFERYKGSPEWRLHNTDMTVEQFKFIYMMEYGHRSLGRFMGIAFVLPWLFFMARRTIKPSEPLNKLLGATLALGGVQGLIGWWMVKSGLTEEDNVHKAKVSPYRLATHLIIAFTILIGLSIVKQRASHATIEVILKDKVIPHSQFVGLYTPKRLSHILALFTFMTAFSGAFVAGNDAGLVYNEFPLMGGQIVPSDFISPYIKPAILNIFENPSAIQFIHRCLAITTFTLSWVTTISCHMRANCLPPVRNAAATVALVASIQAALGISTLLMHVPTEFASMHQCGAMVLILATSRLVFVAGRPLLGLPQIEKDLRRHDDLLDAVIKHQLDSGKAAHSSGPGAPGAGGAAMARGFSSVARTTVTNQAMARLTASSTRRWVPPRPTGLSSLVGKSARTSLHPHAFARSMALPMVALGAGAYLTASTPVSHRNTPMPSPTSQQGTSRVLDDSSLWILARPYTGQ